MPPGAAGLRRLIAAGNTAAAMVMINEVEDYHDCEFLVTEVLRNSQSTPALVEAVLEKFLSTRENRKGEHGNWVHSLSHFMNDLWELRLLEWIKRLNEIAFRGANELRDPNCSSLLIVSFARKSRWDDDPADFHITKRMIGAWIDWQFIPEIRVRFEAGKFKTEAAYLAWKARQR